MSEKIYSVGELTKELKELLESSFAKIWIEGEISNYLKHSSGHRYFTLKDQNAQIKCVVWRWTGNFLSFEPQDGMKVKASGQVTIYEKSGQYQLVISSLQPAGIGELELAFQRLKKKLAEEGLFDPAHKVPIPNFPERIGVVTSPTGAAIKDILNITKRRAPHIEIIIWPVKVQGEGAAAQIAQAIDKFNRLGLVDVIIVGRGGGSLEDLWAFNEEIVARAIYSSQLPIISAVGHEIDFCIADFVADLRAPTPSAAAEMVTPNTVDLMANLRDLRQSLKDEINNCLTDGMRRLDELHSRYGLRRPLEIVAQRAQRCDELSRLVNLHFMHQMNTRAQKARSIFEKLEIVSPLSILKRGYAYCRDEKGQSVKSFRDVAIDDKLDIVLYEGGVETRITRIKPGVQKNMGSSKNNA